MSFVSIRTKDKELKAEPRWTSKEKDKRVELIQPHGHSGINEEACKKRFQTYIYEISTLMQTKQIKCYDHIYNYLNVLEQTNPLWMELCRRMKNK